MRTNNSQQIVDMVESQVIAAISKAEQIDTAIESKCNIAFLLSGDICGMEEIVKKLQAGGMVVFVHLDLIEGLKGDKKAIEFIAKNIKPEGIITTKPFLIKFAKSMNLITIQRLFILDSTAFKKGLHMIEDSKPDAIEILPGIIPKVVDRIAKQNDIPIITGGLLETEEEVMSCLEAGALATSVGTTSLWNTEL